MIYNGHVYRKFFTCELGKNQLLKPGSQYDNNYIDARIMIQVYFDARQKTKINRNACPALYCLKLLHYYYIFMFCSVYNIMLTRQNNNVSDTNTVMHKVKD